MEFLLAFCFCKVIAENGPRQAICKRWNDNFTGQPTLWMRRVQSWNLEFVEPRGGALYKI